MSTHEQTVRTWIDRAINAGDLAVIDALAHPDYVYRSPGEELRGAAAIKGLLAAYRAAFPDLHVRIDELVAAGDRVVVCFTLTGTHDGELMGSAATGNRVEVHGTVLSRFAEGRIVEEWEVLDRFALYQQLGLVSL